MNENSEQTAARDVLQSSELTARLLRRMTVSPGVLDTTMLRQVLARLAAWSMRPASLFEELMSRYRIDDDSIDADDPLVMAQSWMASINAYLTNSNSFSSTINQFISDVAASQSSAATNVSTSSKLEASRESHLSSVTSQLRKAALPPPSTFSSNAPARSSSVHLQNPDAGMTLPGDDATLSPATKFRISRSPARRVWDAAPVDASDVAPRPSLKSAEDSTSTASNEARTSGEEDRPSKAAAEKSEQTRVMKSEPPRAIAPAAKTPGDLPLARTQITQSEIQHKLPDEGRSMSQQVSKADAINERRQFTQVEPPATTTGASPEHRPANPARDIKKTESASNESISFAGDEPGMNGLPPADSSSNPAQAQTLHSVPAPTKTPSAASHKTLPLVQQQLASSQAGRQPPDFVWRKGADVSAMTDPMTSATGNNQMQAANQAGGHTSTTQSPHSQTIVSEATKRKDELRAGSGMTTERILRSISRKLLVERERRGY